jgi:hypothetical protein
MICFSASTAVIGRSPQLHVRSSVAWIERPAFARCASYGGFKSTEAQSA